MYGPFALCLIIIDTSARFSSCKQSQNGILDPVLMTQKQMLMRYSSTYSGLGPVLLVFYVQLNAP